MVEIDAWSTIWHFLTEKWVAKIGELKGMKRQNWRVEGITHQF